MLSGLGLEFARARDEGHQGKMDVQRVPTRQIVAQLPDRLEKRQAFDIADRAADLAQNEIKAFVAFPDEILDGVGDVRDHLNRCAKIIATALARKNVLID